TQSSLWIVMVLRATCELLPADERRRPRDKAAVARCEVPSYQSRDTRQAGDSAAKNGGLAASTGRALLANPPSNRYAARSAQSTRKTPKFTRYPDDESVR